MQYRRLGRTQLDVSEISLGTVELGMEYGLKDRKESNIPTEQDADYLLNHAIDSGINFIDTASLYGNSEEIIGRSLNKTRRSEYILATKCLHRLDEGLHYKEAQKSIVESINKSLLRLKTNYIDLLQVHGRDNLQEEVRMIQDGQVLEVLEKIKKEGKIRFIGYSSYSEEAALEIIKDGNWDTLQIPCNILDQRYLKNVIPEAKKHRLGLIIRSALLKGALTRKSQFIPPKLVPLIEHINHLREFQITTPYSLPELALRFVLSIPDISTIIVGADRIEYLKDAVSVSDGKELKNQIRNKLRNLTLDDPYLLNPGNWEVD
tara:strand:- start:105854 stop:106810 length:957 start_codon:yes stop_codon:yes gene_type:complete